MILDEIVLQNFGVYSDRQAITLTPPSPRKPVILFGGLNGGGKTTLLDAIQLCFFGPFAQCSNRGSIAYQEFLKRCVHRRAEGKEAGIELVFHQRRNGQEETYHLKRYWMANKKGAKERFEVFREGALDPALTENWINQVEDFLPSNIAHLFLFDGEKIESYANGDHSAQLIGSAIENLLGLGIVDQLEKDLETLARRKRLEDLGEDAQRELASAEQQLSKLRNQIDELNQERASIRTHRIDRKRKALTKIEAYYKKLGGELYDQRHEIEARKDEAGKLAEKGNTDLRELAAGDLPLLVVDKLLDALSDQDQREESGRVAREVLTVLQKRDTALVKELRKHTKNEKLLRKVRDLQATDRKKRKELAKVDIRLDLSGEARSRLHTLRDGGLQESALRARKLLEEQKEYCSRLEHLQTEFASIPATDTLADVVDQRQQIMKEIAEAEGEVKELGDQIARVQRDLERREQEVTRLLENDAQAGIAREDRERILGHSSKVRGTLDRFRKSVIYGHVNRIEGLVLECYQQLLRKKTLVTGLSIDPNSYVIVLYGENWQKLEPSRLSAGERQLLGVALLWGLARASGRPLPTAIDTPLGRLDTAHRSNLVERYFPFASHQVILLSTDEEIYGEYLKKLSPWIGRSYQLEYDDETGSTKIEPGYFKERRAADAA